MGRYAFTHNLPVHSIRRQIDLTRPGGRSIIYEYFLEERRLAQGSQYSCKVPGGKPDATAAPVRESNEEPVICFGLHFDYVPIHFTPVVRYRPLLPLRSLSITDGGAARGGYGGCTPCPARCGTGFDTHVAGDHKEVA